MKTQGNAATLGQALTSATTNGITYGLSTQLLDLLGKQPFNLLLEGQHYMY